MKKSLFGMLSLALVLVAGLFVLYCGSSSEEKQCPDKCGAGKECCTECPCATGTCNAEGKCETTTGCCPTAPQGKNYIYVKGNVKDITTGQGAKVFTAAISPMDALTNPQPTPLKSAVSAETTGAFSLDCFDVTDVVLGMVVLTDDETPDGTGGTYFPTGTGVKGWSTPEEKVCVDNAVVFAVPNAMVTALKQLPSVDPDKNGFIMGMVMNKNNQPVEGAVVKKAGGADLNTIYYPSADFSKFDGTSTSANGIFIIPGPYSLADGKLIAEKTGMQFGEAQAASKAGFCYWAMIFEK